MVYGVVWWVWWVWWVWVPLTHSLTHSLIVAPSLIHTLTSLIVCQVRMARNPDIVLGFLREVKGLCITHTGFVACDV